MDRQEESAVESQLPEPPFGFPAEEAGLVQFGDGPQRGHDVSRPSSMQVREQMDRPPQRVPTENPGNGQVGRPHPVEGGGDSPEEIPSVAREDLRLEPRPPQALGQGVGVQPHVAARGEGVPDSVGQG
jgi:hypothetical protein